MRRGFPWGECFAVDLCKRFEAFLADRCKGKDATKLRFAVE